MPYFSIPLLTLGWFIILIIIALLIRSIRRKIIKHTIKVVKHIDKMTDVKVSTKDTFRRPLRFTSQKS